MKRNYSIISIIAVVVFVFACGKPQETENKVIHNDILTTCNLAIQNAIVVDHVAAPVGSRRYVYASIAAYEALVPFYAEYQSAAPMMNGLKAAPAPDTSKRYCLD
ncbi:MAG: hypothetical protein EBQ97_07920, partial [Bacteroidetes bacterium]|nr:hypothetical protein [Bacteroidota bacterium]